MLYSIGGAGSSTASVCPEVSVSTSSITLSGSFISVIWTLAPETGLEAIIEDTFAWKYPVSSVCCMRIEAGIKITSFLRHYNAILFLYYYMRN
ncbi:MAG: hypothetical protein K1W06_00215 [Lachnospiraceae bacterium]